MKAMFGDSHKLSSPIQNYANNNKAAHNLMMLQTTEFARLRVFLQFFHMFCIFEAYRLSFFKVNKNFQTILDYLLRSEEVRSDLANGQDNRPSSKTIKCTTPLLHNNRPVTHKLLFCCAVGRRHRYYK